MNIVYNSPEHAKQRQSVKPLSMEEITDCVRYLNEFCIRLKFAQHIVPASIIESWQKLIFDYENLAHMRETYPKWIDVNYALPATDVEVLVMRPSAKKYGDDIICIRSFTKYGFNGVHTITHWMPLPSAPQSVNDIDVNDAKIVKE